MITLGNTEIINLYKTAFLCSRKISASAVLKCYDWAISKRDAGECVISGFHSKLEKDVLYYLLKGKQPIIVAIARGIKEYLEPELQKPLDNGRLLFVSPFATDVKRITQDTANIRNRFMMNLADEIVLGHINPDGGLHKLVKEFEGLKKISLL